MSRSPSKNDTPTCVRKPTAMARAAGLAALSALTFMPWVPAAAADGCTVMLCLAAPNWRDIPECVPPVHQVLRDLSRGKPFPACEMSGSGSGASHAWAAAPDFCPPQYTFLLELESGTRPECLYAGAITVNVDGRRFTRTWWSQSGDAVTDFSPSAKAQLGNWDRRFDAEYATWLASRPAPVESN